MSDSITLEVSARDTLGKSVKRLRKDGIVPAVIHDHGHESVHVQADFRDVTKVVHAAGKHHPVDITLGGKKYTTLIRSISFDPRLNSVTHVVFNAVSANQKVDASVPVLPRYAEGNESSPAERTGLIVLSQLEEVEVKALPKDLPDQLFYDAEKLIAVGDHVTVSDLEVPAGVVVESEATHALATVFEPSALAAANEAAAGEAEAGDEASVASDNQSGAVEGTQADEIRPGGKEQKESKDQGREPEKN